MSSSKPVSSSTSPLRKLRLGRRLHGLIRFAFLASGAFALICGVVFLLTDRVVLFPKQKAISLLSAEAAPSPGSPRSLLFHAIKPQTVLALPEWAAMTMLVIGTASTAFGITSRRA